MAVVYKYNISNKRVLQIPCCKILDVQFQNDELVLWALVNPNGREKEVTVNAFWTGEEIGAETLRDFDYLKTLQDSLGFVWHIFIKVD